MLEYRDQSDTVGLIKGPATTWTPPAKPYFVNDPRVGTFLEQFERGALVWDNAELRRDHNPDTYFAQTSDGTLRLSDEPHSLYLAAALDKTDPGTRALISDIKEQRLTGLSIGFKPDQDRWSKAADGRTELRVVTRALLVEVSAVIKAANPGARIDEARQEYRSDNGIEYRSVPLVYRDAPFGGDQDDVPPNLHTPGQGATDHCSNCAAFDRAGSVCLMYDNYSVRPTEVCDSWTDDWSPMEGRRRYSDSDRKAMAKSGQALPDGSYPIMGKQDLINAITAVGRAKDIPRARAHIIKRAKQMGLTSLLPKSWAESTKRARLAPAGTEALYWELQLHGCGGMDKRVQLEPNDSDELAMELALKRAV